MRATGIIWLAPIFDLRGYGSVSRGFITGLRRLGMPVRAVNLLRTDFSADLPPHHVREIKDSLETDVGDRPIGVVHYMADRFSWVRFHGLVARVGCTIWETDRIPPRWVTACNQMDEVWVPSAFNVESFSSSGVKKAKLQVIPYGIDTDLYRPAVLSKEKLWDAGFVFLYVFAFGWRKGFDLLLEAYVKEFRREEDVLLVVKVNAGENVPRRDLRRVIFDSVRDKIDPMAPSRPPIVILGEEMDHARLLELYSACDLYISTDRANGWGMPCMEVMALGKAAATIDWSGSTQFMNAENSLLIRPTGRLVPVDDRLTRMYPEYFKGHQWAEVDVAEVRRVMRWAFGHREELARIGVKARSDMVKNYSIEAAARRIIERANELVEKSEVRDLGKRRPGVRIRIPITHSFYWGGKLARKLKYRFLSSAREERHCP